MFESGRCEDYGGCCGEWECDEYYYCYADDFDSGAVFVDESDCAGCDGDCRGEGGGVGGLDEFGGGCGFGLGGSR